MPDKYLELKSELRSELNRILDYWSSHTIDAVHGGFLGRIDHENRPVKNSSKGIILNTRILWSFSAASNHFGTNTYINICDRAYNYLAKHFKDKAHHGVFWELDFKGTPVNRRKQIYAQAFAIYALSEYYIFSKDEGARDWAIELFELIEKYAKDDKKDGYLEAFDEDWTPIEDVRLSAKDMNATKTMNTHLHIMEAYTRLSDIYDNPNLKKSLRNLLLLFQNTFLNQENHYDLFFDDDWKLLSSTISYGHNIETAWLTIEAAKRIDDDELLKHTQESAIKVVDTFLKEALDADKGIINEKNRATGEIDTDRHWWPQIEAIIGLKYAYELTNESHYIEKALDTWQFTKMFLIDQKNGEWHFRVNKNGRPYTEEDKVSMWKAPYHNTRGCIILNSAF